MNLKRIVRCTGTLLVLATLLVACSKGGRTPAAAFDGASPEIKAVWEKALTADAANDYVSATVAYKGVLRQRDKLTADQVKAAENSSGRLYQRLVDASMKGEADARKALDTLGAMDRGQPLSPR